MSQNTIIPNTSSIDKFFKDFDLSLYLSKSTLAHFKSFFKAAVVKVKAKTTDIAEQSPRHRTTIGHFLNKGVWDESHIQRRMKQTVLQHTLNLSRSSDEPLFVIHDDTACAKASPSSRAQKPMQGTGFIFLT